MSRLGGADTHRWSHGESNPDLLNAIQQTPGQLTGESVNPPAKDGSKSKINIETEGHENVSVKIEVDGVLPHRFITRHVFRRCFVRTETAPASSRKRRKRVEGAQDPLRPADKWVLAAMAHASEIDGDGALVFRFHGKALDAFFASIGMSISHGYGSLKVLTKVGLIREAWSGPCRIFELPMPAEPGPGSLHWRGQFASDPSEPQLFGDPEAVGGNEKCARPGGHSPLERAQSTRADTHLRAPGWNESTRARAVHPGARNLSPPEWTQSTGARADSGDVSQNPRSLACARADGVVVVDVVNNNNVEAGKDERVELLRSEGFSDPDISSLLAHPKCSLQQIRVAVTLADQCKSFKTGREAFVRAAIVNGWKLRGKQADDGASMTRRILDRFRKREGGAP